MIDSVNFTRRGWIKHLTMTQKILWLSGQIFESVRMSFPAAECEKDRSEKIFKSIVKLEEAVWEAGAVSERIHRENGRDESPFDAADRDTTNKMDEQRRKNLHDAARRLVELAQQIYDEDAPEIVEPEVVYPGAMEKPDPQNDPNQRILPFPAEEHQPPEVNPSNLIDYKKRAANDDTDMVEGGEDDDEQ